MTIQICSVNQECCAQSSVFRRWASTANEEIRVLLLLNVWKIRKMQNNSNSHLLHDILRLILHPKNPSCYSKINFTPPKKIPLWDWTSNPLLPFQPYWVIWERQRSQWLGVCNSRQGGMEHKVRPTAWIRGICEGQRKSGIWKSSWTT